VTDRRAPIAVALDTGEIDTAVSWASLVAGPAAAVKATAVKVGLELYLRAGAGGVERIRGAAPGAELFLDLKLHDIPNTVAGATRSVAQLDPNYLTVHASGGPDMVRAAAEALPSGKVAAVTILTSLNADDLAAIGIAGPPADAVVRLAHLAVKAGAQALVCSPHEVALVRAEVGPEVTLITPGVRPAGSAAADQARVATPEQAVRDGADLVVVGRPVTAHADPAGALAELAGQLSR